MAKIPKLVAQIKSNPKNVRFSDLVKVCNYYFGDPRINIQDKKGKAKSYQVKQVLIAIVKMEEINND